MRKAILLFLISIQLSAQKLELIDSKELFTDASSLSINSLKSIFVSEISKNEIYQFDTELNLIRTYGGFGSGVDNFDMPIDVFSTTLNTFITDKNNNRIQVFDKDLNFLFTFDLINNQQGAQIYYPLSCSVSSAGDYFVLDADNNQIVKFSSAGNFLQQFGNYESGKYQLENPIKVLINNLGKIIVVQYHRLTLFDYFGAGIMNINFDYKISSASFINNKLILNSTNKISVLNFTNLSKLFEIDLNNELEINDIRQASLIDNFLIVLTSKCIYKFLIKM